MEPVGDAFPFDAVIDSPRTGGCYLGKQFLIIFSLASADGDSTEGRHPVCINPSRPSPALPAAQWDSQAVGLCGDGSTVLQVVLQGDKRGKMEQLQRVSAVMQTECSHGWDGDGAEWFFQRAEQMVQKNETVRLEAVLPKIIRVQLANRTSPNVTGFKIRKNAWSGFRPFASAKSKQSSVCFSALRSAADGKQMQAERLLRRIVLHARI